MLMSDSFYHTRYCLTKTQEEVIKPLLPASDRTTRLKSHNGIQCYFVDIIFRSVVARVTTSLRQPEQHLSQVPTLVRR